MVRFHQRLLYGGQCRLYNQSLGYVIAPHSGGYLTSSLMHHDGLTILGRRRRPQDFLSPPSNGFSQWYHGPGPRQNMIGGIGNELEKLSLPIIQDR